MLNWPHSGSLNEIQRPLVNVQLKSESNQDIGMHKHELLVSTRTSHSLLQWPPFRRYTAYHSGPWDRGENSYRHRGHCAWGNMTGIVYIDWVSNRIRKKVMKYKKQSRNLTFWILLSYKNRTTTHTKSHKKVKKKKKSFNKVSACFALNDSMLCGVPIPRI